VPRGKLRRVGRLAAVEAWSKPKVSTRGPEGPRVKISILPAHPACPDAMDIERINQLGSLLADLTARTDALRGYL
jgi:hypothetical protein